MTQKEAAVNENSSNKEKQKKASIASKNPLLFTLAVQLLAVLPVSAILGLLNKLWLTSFLWGALVYVVPNAYFTLYAFRYSKSGNSQLIVKSFYTGEFGKHALAAAGFALVLKFVSPLHLPTVFAGFMGLISVQWLIAWQIAKSLENQI